MMIETLDENAYGCDSDERIVAVDSYIARRDGCLVDVLPSVSRREDQLKEILQIAFHVMLMTVMILASVGISANALQRYIKNAIFMYLCYLLTLIFCMLVK